MHSVRQLKRLGSNSFVVGLLWSILGIILFCGLKLIQPQEALVLTLFGKYIGTLKEAGFFYVNCFVGNQSRIQNSIRSKQ